MPTAVLLSGGLDSAVLVAEEAARSEVQPIYVSVGLAWERAEREAAHLSCRNCHRWREIARDAHRRHERRVPSDPLGDGGTAPRLSHAGRGRVPAGTQHRAPRKSRRVLRVRGHRSAGARHARSQSVSGRDAGVSAPPWRRHCRSALRTPSRSTRPSQKRARLK